MVKALSLPELVSLDCFVEVGVSFYSSSRMGNQLKTGNCQSETSSNSMEGYECKGMGTVLNRGLPLAV